MQPKVSIIIQNWNGEEYLKECLDSVFAQDYKNIEVIVVDSASKDKSLEMIKKYKKAKLITLQEDKGAPHANNLGCAESKGEYIMLLNNDTMLLNGTIKNLVKMAQDENCVVSPIQLDWDGKVTGCGCPHYWGGTTLNKLFRINSNEPFYLSIACCLFSRKVFDEFHLNDNFWFYEEVEWAWRMRLRGIKLRMCENSFFKHKQGGTVTTGKTAFNVAKSITATHFICMKSFGIIFIMPLVFYNHSRLILVETLRKRKPVFIKKFMQGIFSFISNIDAFSKQRHKVQSTRIYGDFYIIKKMIGSAGYVKEMERKYGMK